MEINFVNNCFEHECLLISNKNLNLETQKIFAFKNILSAFLEICLQFYLAHGPVFARSDFYIKIYNGITIVTSTLNLIHGVFVTSSYVINHETCISARCDVSKRVERGRRPPFSTNPQMANGVGRRKGKDRFEIDASTISGCLLDFKLVD